MENLIFRRFTVGSYPINGYLVAAPLTKIGIFIDPGGFSSEVEAFIRDHQIQLQYLFITHGHWYHIEGLQEFYRRYPVNSYAGRGEVGTVNNP